MSKIPNTKVYVVVGNVDYEGSDVLGVFSTPRRAHNFVKLPREMYYDSVIVTSWKLNSKTEKGAE